MENKYCNKCSCSQPVENFGKDRTTKDGLTACCKTCRNLMSSNWRKNNPDKAKKATAEWVSRNKDHVLELARENSRKRREQLAPGEDAGIQREWRLNNPENVKRHYQSRLKRHGKARLNHINSVHRVINSEHYSKLDADKRAKRLMRYVKWADHKKIAEVYAEARRLIQLNKEMYHVDHEVPLQGKLVCGLHNQFNVRVIKAKDNLSKGAKFEVTIDE